MFFKKAKISNWGNYPVIESEVFLSDDPEVIKNIVKENDSILARGNGRSYGDASLYKKVFLSLKLDKITGFDLEKGVIICQSGVLLSDLLSIIVPKRYFLPVTPGTKFITIGGAIAADVHGKNHHADGCFSDYLISFTIINENGELLLCSKEENSSLFWSTIGGMGLTGIIISASFKLKKIESSYLNLESIKAPDLESIMNLFEESENYTYTVAWIDCLQKGKNIGRSILMRGEHATLERLPFNLKKEPLKIPAKTKLNIPVYFPGWWLNTFSVKVFNFLYYYQQFQKSRKNIIDYETFFYPLDAIHNWNRMYGKQGFTQYQFVLPKETSLEGLKEILSFISNSGEGSFLAVLKLFGKKNPLAEKSFPIEGYTLALDFKITPTIKSLIKKLDELVYKYGGKIYLAKDAFSSSKMFGSEYENKISKFNSDQYKRLFKA